MVCPTADIPTYGRGVWLECNGQSFDRNRFPQLYETLGTTRVPDYQGMFLRGYGSQDFRQYSGFYKGDKTYTYSSGSIGEIQGDATRRWRGTTQAGYGGFNRGGESYWGLGGSAWEEASDGDLEALAIYSTINGSGAPYHMLDETLIASFPILSPLNIGNGLDYTENFTSFRTNTFYGIDGGWYDALTKYKYTISCSIGEDGGDCTLNEEEIHPELAPTASSMIVVMGNELVMPIADEIRPINVAVKFMIKAK